MTDDAADDEDDDCDGDVVCCPTFDPALGAVVQG